MAYISTSRPNSGKTWKSPSLTIRPVTKFSVLLALIVSLAVFGLSPVRANATPNSTEHLQSIITAALTNPDGVTVTPSEKAALVKAGASGPISNSVTVGAQRMDGFTLNFSWQGLKLRIGWTIQPHTVAAIDNFIRSNPYATAAAMEMVGAMACRTEVSLVQVHIDN